MKKNTHIDSAKKIIQSEIKSLQRLVKKIDGTFSRACELVLNSSGKIVTIGLGKSGHIAKKMSATLSSTGTPSIFIHASEALHGDMGAINKNDIIIFYSNSGETKEILQLLPLVKIIKSKIISITGNLKSTLAKKSTVALDASVTREACPLNLAPSSSSMCALAISDAIALTVSSNKGFTSKDFAKTHPEGSLGKRLLKKIENIMIKGKLPIVHENSSFNALIKKTNVYNLGLVLICNDKNKLLGVITDGDIKRIIQNNKDIESIQIKNVMTKKPILISKDILAAEALSIFEDNQINALPVVNKNILEGLVTIQMLIKSLE